MRSETSKLSPHPGPLPFGRGEGESPKTGSRRKVLNESSRKQPRIEPKNRRSRDHADHRSIAQELPCGAGFSTASQTGSAAIQQIGNLRYEVRGERGGKREGSQDAAVDLLILSDGTILIHNLTPAMAAILNKVNPQDKTIQRRAFAKRR